MTTTITRELAERTLRDIAAENPDHIAEKCRYVFQNESCCLAGKALDRMGVPLDTLRRMDKESGSLYANEMQVSELLELAGFEIDHDAYMLLHRAQAFQDGMARAAEKFPWGKAVAGAIRGIDPRDYTYSDDLPEVLTPDSIDSL